MYGETWVEKNLLLMSNVTDEKQALNCEAHKTQPSTHSLKTKIVFTGKLFIVVVWCNKVLIYLKAFFVGSFIVNYTDHFLLVSSKYFRRN
jgi:hypothetical protein